MLKHENNNAINTELKRLAEEKRDIQDLEKVNKAKDILQHKIIQDQQMEQEKILEDEAMRLEEEKRFAEEEAEYKRVQLEKELAVQKKAQVKKLAADIAQKECETAHQEYLQAMEYQDSLHKSMQGLKHEIATCKSMLQACTKEIEDLHKVKQTAERIVESKKNEESKIFEERRVLTGLVEDARVKASRNRQFEKVHKETTQLLSDIIQKEQHITSQKNIAQDTISDIIDKLELVSTKIQSTTSERMTAEGTLKSLSKEYQLATKETKNKEKLYLTTHSAATLPTLQKPATLIMDNIKKYHPFR